MVDRGYINTSTSQSILEQQSQLNDIDQIGNSAFSLPTEMTSNNLDITVNVVSKDDLLNPYTVEDGDSLWGIAEQVYGDGNQWTQVYSSNSHIIGSDPDLIHPGQEFVLPNIDTEDVLLSHQETSIVETKFEDNLDDSSLDNCEESVYPIEQDSIFSDINLEDDAWHSHDTFES
ncbi:LysM peptidoglycan-binding domain-containing protein (plasmid) [Acaryochloris sp. 'Moss Beach']|nr:LysM peptidoglycan-binding domain-containing protein [Acaryochloris sp. 'Moss Beach']